MWPFKRKKANKKQPSGPPCVHCGSTNTIVVSHGVDQSDNIRSWRGQRYVTCRCLDCGRDFYSDEDQAAEARAAAEDRIIDDEEALHAAEEELKKQSDDERDHRFRPGG